MHRTIVFALAAVCASAAGAQSAQRPTPNDPKAKVPAVEYRSAFDGYRRFAGEDASDWRKSNEEVGAAGGHAGHGRGQGAGAKSSKPQPGQSNK